MDPTSFTKTSFCNVEVDNITDNESKSYILNHMNIHTNIQYNSRYAKVFNKQFANNLNNPHILCLKSSGTPYLLYITKINDIKYIFFIDKKLNQGYSYPKIFILPIVFQDSFYQNSLFECELLRDKQNKWSILIGDSYILEGKSMKKMIIIDRIQKLHSLFNEYQECEFNKQCQLVIKKYFDYKDYENIMKEFVPNLSYDIRGIYFIPLKWNYSNILYLFKKDRYIDNNHKNKQEIVKEDIMIQNFRIMKTLKPDVYELYTTKNDQLEKIGNALVQSIEDSHKLLNIFKNKDICEKVIMKCQYNSFLKKYRPLEII